MDIDKQTDNKPFFLELLTELKILTAQLRNFIGITNSIQGVPKKTLFSGILAITPLWKGLEKKLGGVSKASGNSLCDRHKNFPN